MGLFNRIKNLFNRPSYNKEETRGFFERQREKRQERKRRRDYERSRRRMEKWERKEQKQREKEKARRAAEEQRQKEADRKKRQQAYNRAYNTFSDRYGMSENEYRGLIDVWGGVTQDMKDIFGDSKKGDGSLVYAYKELSPEHRQNFPAILQSVMNDIEGQGYNQEQAINKLYDTIDYLNAGGSL